MTTVRVLVDGENVRRSRWPNIAREELVERCDAWAKEQGVEAEVFWETELSADDRIAARAAELRKAGAPFWVVTSDRALRRRAAGTERILGGGAFVRELDL